MSSSSAPPIATTLPASGVSVRNLPVNLFGSVMSLAGLALAWRLAHGVLGTPAFVGEIIGVLALCVFAVVAAAYLAKAVKHPDAVQAEFRHPIAGNFFGTIAISLLLLSAVLQPYGTPLACAVWTVGVVATFSFSFVAVRRLLDGRMDSLHAVPALLVPGVATLDIPVTGGHLPMDWAAEVNLFAGAVGSMMALVLFGMIVSRLVHHEPIAPGMTPSLMILMAPFAVGFLAYAHLVGTIDRFAGLLFYFALFMFAVVSPRVFRREVKFSTAWWAIGFPMAALANAALSYAASRGGWLLWALAVALLGALSLALAVLAVRTLRIVFDGTLLR